MMEDQDWLLLLGDIQRGEVIPVIGSQLLCNQFGAFYAEVAKELLVVCKRTEISHDQLVTGNEISSAISLICHEDKLKLIDGTDIDGYIRIAIEKVSAKYLADLPLPIRQLAEITDFRLFVYLCPDTLLEQALGQQGVVRSIVHDPTWAKKSPDEDLSIDWESNRQELNLCYLFGKSTRSCFAVHDEDILEFSYNLIKEGPGTPRNIMDEIQRKRLLLIGCGFSDWLARFFLRLSNKERLRKKDIFEWYVDDLSCQKELTIFLNTYSRKTRLIDQLSPPEFVAELHRRWQEKQALKPQVAQNFVPLSAIPDRPIFLLAILAKRMLLPCNAYMKHCSVVKLGQKPRRSGLIVM